MAQQILEYIKDTYNAEPEYLWQATPWNIRKTKTNSEVKKRKELTELVSFIE